MKKAFAWFLAIHLVVFAAAYFVPERHVAVGEAVVSAPDEAKVLAGRFENLLNHLSGYKNQKVENYTLNSDGTYTVFANLVAVDEKGEEKEVQSISRFAVDKNTGAGYELIYFNLLDKDGVSYV